MKRRFRIETGRYGGEIVCGTVSKEFVQYWKDKEEGQLADHLYNLTWGDSEYVDSDSPPTPHEEWSEISDICHTYGAYSDGGFYISEISNEDGSLPGFNFILAIMSVALIALVRKPRH